MKFTDALCLGHEEILADSETSYILGLGVSYQNGADGTTKNLALKYPNRVLDVPVSELSFTGMAVGMSAAGLKPIVHHGRVEFAMLALDQIITQAAKWNFMFGGDYPCPLVSRICIGRQWGNGPQHTFGMHSAFLQTPNLDVYIPATPKSARNSLISSYKSEASSVILEHRWLYKTNEDFEPPALTDERRRHGVSYSIEGGYDFTVLTYADGLLEALAAMRILNGFGVKGSVIAFEYFGSDRNIHPEISEAIQNANKLIILDTSPYQYGVMSGVCSILMKKGLTFSQVNTSYLTPEFQSCPTSTLLTKNYYPNYKSVVDLISSSGEFPSSIGVEEPSFDYINNAPPFNFSGPETVDMLKVEYY